MSRLEELMQELCPDGVEYKKLGEIATVSRGGSLQKKYFCSEDVPCIHYGQIYTRYGLFADKTFTFIGKDCAKKQKLAYPNDMQDYLGRYQDLRDEWNERRDFSQ